MCVCYQLHVVKCCGGSERKIGTGSTEIGAQRFGANCYLMLKDVLNYLCNVPSVDSEQIDL